MTARLRAAALAALAALALAGCTTTQKSTLDDTGPVHVPRNVRGPARWPAQVVRVAVLPAADATGTLPLEFARNYDAPWLQALQHTQRAEFVPIDRETYARWTGSPRPPVSTAALPGDWAARLRAATDADAALLLDLTHCSPYPPLALGVRAKLVDLRTGEIIWAFDELFDAAEPAVARGARRHARAGLQGRDGEAIAILQSPSRFAAYVAETTGQTLPPR